MIRTLAASGASFDAVNKDNLTPLLLAEKPETVKPVAANTDVKNECTASMSTCKQDNCNGTMGATGCDVPNNVSCGAASCATAGGVSTQTNPTCVAGACTMPTSSSTCTVRH